MCKTLNLRDPIQTPSSPPSSFFFFFPKPLSPPLSPPLLRAPHAPRGETLDLVMPPRPSLQSLLLMAASAAAGGDSGLLLAARRRLPAAALAAGGHRIRLLHAFSAASRRGRHEVACCVRTEPAPRPASPVAVRSRSGMEQLAFELRTCAILFSPCFTRRSVAGNTLLNGVSPINFVARYYCTFRRLAVNPPKCCVLNFLSPGTP